jgi:hypothetical protein
MQSLNTDYLFLLMFMTFDIKSIRNIIYDYFILSAMVCKLTYFNYLASVLFHRSNYYTYLNFCVTKIRYIMYNYIKKNPP